VVSVTPRLLFAPGKDPVPVVQEAGWATGPVWTGAENLAPNRDSIPGRSLPPGKTRYPLYRRLGGLQGRSGQVRKISPPNRDSIPGRSLPPGKTRYPLYRRLGGLQGRSGQVRNISPPTGIRSPDRPARSQSLYRIRYPAHLQSQRTTFIFCENGTGRSRIRQIEPSAISRCGGSKPCALNAARQ